MNVSFKGEILLPQCMHLLQLVTVVPSTQPWMEKEIIEGKVPIDSVRRGELFTPGLHSAWVGRFGNMQKHVTSSK